MYKLNELSAIFCKQANLISDMARRIMFSLIPGERFDFVAARWAANGAISSVTYGTKAINEELRHYKGEIPRIGARNIVNFVSKSLDKFNLNNAETYQFFLETAINMFNDSGNWENQFGGEAWGNIAKTVLKLVSLYVSLMNVKKWSDEEEEILKQIIIYLNLLDGIMHNTGKVFEKMIEAEKLTELTEENSDPFEEKEKDVDRIYRMRNATELEDPIYAFKEIEDLLYPKNVYKDYITKLRNTKEYYTVGDPTKKLDEITAIKNLKNDRYKYSKIHNQAEYIRIVETIIRDMDNRANTLINLLKQNIDISMAANEAFVWDLRYLFYFPKDQWGQAYFSVAGIVPFIDRLPKQKEVIELIEDSNTLADYFNIFNYIYARSFTKPVSNIIAGWYKKITPELYKEMQKMDVKKIANDIKSLMEDSVPIFKRMHENFIQIVSQYE